MLLPPHVQPLYLSWIPWDLYHLHTGESPDCPSLRASNDHSFIVGVPRARRIVWRLHPPSKLTLHHLQGWGLIDLPLCASGRICCSLLSKQGREELSTAAVERGPSEGARSGSKESSSRPCTPLPLLRAQRFSKGLNQASLSWRFCEQEE